MSEMSNEAVQAQIRARGLKIGNAVATTDASSDIPAYAAVTQLSVDAQGKLQGTVAPTMVQPTNTGEVFNATGSPNGNIMTQTLVAGASATTATTGGWMRVFITTDNEAIMSSGFYYVPLVTLT